jgi:4-hydroxy-tetrahydrodipicolinate synthase
MTANPEQKADANIGSSAKSRRAKDVGARGVFAAVLTPLDRRLEPDVGALKDHCAWLMANGCDGLAMLGTTGEANSLSVAQRRRMLDGVANAFPPATILPGVGSCALADAIELSRLATESGCAGVLVLPPFFYKNPAEEGLYQFYAQLIERVNDVRLRLYLYHFPQMSSVAIPVNLIVRLTDAFPGIVAGLKDSSGDWSYSRDLLKRLPGLGVFSGSEEFLLENLRAGGAGCISATVNLTAPVVARVMAAIGAAGPASAEAAALQAHATAARHVLQRYPLLSSLKYLKARLAKDSGWERMLPPLTALSAQQRADLLSDLGEVDDILRKELALASLFQGESPR